MKYRFFAQILALLRARKSTNPTIPLNAEEYKEASDMVGVVDSRALHGANIRAKRGTSPKNKIILCARLDRRILTDLRTCYFITCCTSYRCVSVRSKHRMNRSILFFVFYSNCSDAAGYRTYSYHYLLPLWR